MNAARGGWQHSAIDLALPSKRILPNPTHPELFHIAGSSPAETRVQGALAPSQHWPVGNTCSCRQHPDVMAKTAQLEQTRAEGRHRKVMLGGPS